MKPIPRLLLSLAVCAMLQAGLPPANPVRAGGFVSSCTRATDYRFVVSIANVSDRSDRPVSFTPGVWALSRQPSPLFHPGLPVGSLGLEALAEDGNPVSLSTALGARGLVHGVFDTPVGTGEPGPLRPGESYEFTVNASYAPRNLFLALTLAEANDWFIGTGSEGIALHNGMGGAFQGGDVTHHLHLWDAGTEEDEPLGAGLHQVLSQAHPDTGPGDPQTQVRQVRTEAGLPAVAEWMQVTIARVRPTVFDVTLTNVSDQSPHPSPFAAGVYAVHTDPSIFYLEGHPQLFQEGRAHLYNGLEALAEDGDPDRIFNSIATAGGMTEEPVDGEYGTFHTPVGFDSPGLLLPGQTYAFAAATDRDRPQLSLALMYVESNDWFAATADTGFSLFQADGAPVSGVIPMHLYDAGTEEDEPLGLGGHQFPRQTAPNSGPADDDATVRRVRGLHGSDLLRATVTPRQPQAFRISIANVSARHIPLPGIMVSHGECDVFPLSGSESLVASGDFAPWATSLRAEGLQVQVTGEASDTDGFWSLAPGASRETILVVDPAAPNLSLAFRYGKGTEGRFFGTPPGGIALWDDTGAPLSDELTPYLRFWASEPRNMDRDTVHHPTLDGLLRVMVEPLDTP